MGASAADEKQTLAEDLVEARALIERGEFEGGLDALVRLRETALTDHDASLLVEVRLLAERVSARALTKGDRKRANSLVLAMKDDRVGHPGSPRRPWPTLRRWSLIVAAVWLVVSGVTAAVISESANPDAFISPAAQAVIVVIFFAAVALGVWLLGVLILLARRRIRRKGDSTVGKRGIGYMTAYALSALLAGAILACVGGLINAAVSSGDAPNGPVKVADGYCQQEPSNARILTRVYMHTTDGTNKFDDVWYEYKYDDGGDTLDMPLAPSGQSKTTFVPSDGRWVTFYHPYNFDQHNVTECLVSYNDLGNTKHLTVLPSRDT